MILHRLTVLGRVLLGLIWSIGLVMGGAYLMRIGPVQLRTLAPGTVVTFGLASIAAGQFIFMVIVADRIFPAAWTKGVAVCEWVTAATLALLMGISAMFYVLA